MIGFICYKRIHDKWTIQYFKLASTTHSHFVSNNYGKLAPKWTRNRITFSLFTLRKKITRFFHCLLFTCVPFCCRKTHKNKVKKVKRKKTIDAKVNLNWDGKINPIASHMSLDNIPIFVWQSSLQHHFSIFTHIWVYTIVRMSHVQLTSNAEKRKNLVYVRDLYAFEGLAFFYSFLLFFSCLTNWNNAQDARVRLKRIDETIFDANSKQRTPNKDL